MSGITLEAVSGEVRVRFSYDDLLVERMKDLGLEWVKDGKFWATRDARVAATVYREFGDSVPPEVVEAERLRERMYRASTAKASVFRPPAPPGLSYIPFQRAGIAFGIECEESVLIGDEMGLGKTIQGIGIVNCHRELVGDYYPSVLIVCPATLKPNWKKEFEKWSVMPLSVGIAGDSFPGTDVVIVNYDVLHKWRSVIESRDWDYVILDEMHYLKSGSARRTKAIAGTSKRSPEGETKAIRGKVKTIGMTGTPIVNRPVELWPLLHYLRPKEWKNFMLFGRRYCGAAKGRFGWEFGGASNLDELHRRLRETVMVRRLKADVLTDLPPKRRQIIEIPAEKLGALIREELEAAKSLGRAKKKARAVREMIDQAKAARAPTVQVDEFRRQLRGLKEEIDRLGGALATLRKKTGEAKVPFVIPFVEAVVEADGKVVFMGYHPSVVDRVTDHFGAASVKIHGGIPVGEQREEAKVRFQGDPSVSVFGGTITAAGVGLTLTASQTVVFGELDWVPGNMTQAEDRCHRIGQEGNVLIQIIVLEGSLDAIMAKRIVEKQEVIDAALDGTPIPSDFDQEVSVECLVENE